MSNEYQDVIQTKYADDLISHNQVWFGYALLWCYGKLNKVCLLK